MSLLSKREHIALEILKPLLANHDANAIANAFELADAFMQVSPLTNSNTHKTQTNQPSHGNLDAPTAQPLATAGTASVSQASQPHAILKESPKVDNNSFKIFNHDHPKTKGN